MKAKILAWLLVVSMGIAAVPTCEYAKNEKSQAVEAAQEVEGQKGRGENKECDADSTPKEPEIVEVADLDALARAASLTEAKESDALSAVMNPWQSRRLLVKSEAEFDAFGAESVILGYGNIFILNYATEEATRAAYESLKEISGLTVEPDCPIGQTAKETETKSEKNARDLSGEIQNAGTPPSGAEVLAAVLDTGYGVEGQENARVVNGADLTASGGSWDTNGHGTAMANIILEHTPDCVKVMPIKVADESGWASVLTLYMGICSAIEHQADLIHISMSSYKAANSQLLCEAIGRARAAGIPVVVSAGNSGRDIADFSPANVEEAIAVSAVDDALSLAEYSNYGAGVDYCAYGTLTVTDLHGNRTRQEGTSVAAAIVSAAIAEQKAYRPNCTYEEFFAVCEQAAEDLGEAGKDALYGSGLLLPKSLLAKKEETEEAKENTAQTGAEKPNSLIFCDWKHRSREELDDLIGKASNMERRIFLDELSEKELSLLLSMDTMFSREIVYSENRFDETGNTTETLRMEGVLYDVVMNMEFDKFEIQAQKYHIFAYGTNRGTIPSCIKLDTDANTRNAIVYCWMLDHSSAQYNSGEYGLTFDKGNSAFDFSECTSKIEDCDAADNGNPVVWRLKIRGVKANKPQNMVVNYNSEWWNKDTYQRVGNVESGYGKHYWYIFNYQVAPASSASRQRAYGSGRYHGGFWDLKDATGKKCGSTTVTTTLDIGTRDLYTDENRDGITYRLPLTTHENTSSQTGVTDVQATCLQKGSLHYETTYQCAVCSKTWTTSGGSQETPQLAHAYAEKKAADNGIAEGKRWEECNRNCGGNDVNGEFWQKNVQYKQPIRYWEMKKDGTYDDSPTGMVKDTAYYAAGGSMPEWTRTPSDEFVTGRLHSYTVPDHAAYHDVYIRRKRYTVSYDGNGATGGSTASQEVYCGQSFALAKNGYQRIGYEFIGWSKEPDGELLTEKKYQNLSLEDKATVTLYARWIPAIFQISLLNQGANLAAGTKRVYEKYGKGYYMDVLGKTKFPSNKIEIPQKEIPDSTLLDGVRKQRFLGYYTSENGKGALVAKADGSLIPNIGGSEDYQYFSKNSVVYANWEDLYAVQFDPNLTEEEIDAFLKPEDDTSDEPSIVRPFTRWKEKGEEITVGYGEAILKNTQYANLYRFKGWSLTPQITSDEEIILDEKKSAYTFSADEDVTLYAQWDTSFGAAYMGNEQSEGQDAWDVGKCVTDEYHFLQNPFTKTAQKPTVDVLTGQTKKEGGEPYTEDVPYSFQGWSVAKERDKQESYPMYAEEDGISGIELMLAAREAEDAGDGAGITIGEPSADYDGFPSPNAETEQMPFVNLYAIWDQYPQIQATDLYLPLADAQAGVLTEEYLLSLVTATDEELESPENPQGTLKGGIDAEHGTSFTIIDYQMEDFTGAEQEMSVSVTYQAKDKVGNVTEKKIRIYLTDTSGTEYHTGTVRFISEKYMDTLAEDSIWRTEEYATKLAQVLGNQKTGEAYTTVTPVQRAFGIKPAVKPGSGTWSHVQEIWTFTHEEVLAVQDYAKSVGIGGDSAEFLEKFAHCKVR